MKRAGQRLARRFCALVAATCLTTACASSGDKGQPAGDAGIDAEPNEGPTLYFEVDADSSSNGLPTIRLRPQEERELTVVAKPPGSYRIRFAMLPDPGQPPHDASLDRTDVDTDEDGRAHVALRAPSKAANFTLRASIDMQASATLAIAVSDHGFGELQVSPSYEGSRPISHWVAKAYPTTDCANLTPPDAPLDVDVACKDSSLCATSTVGIPPRITDVPVDTSFAVTLSAGNHVYGCTQISDLRANELNTATVTVTNRPMTLDDEGLDVALGISDTTQSWADHLQSAIDGALEAFHGDSENDLALVLDTMAEQIESSDAQLDFSTARAEQEWEPRAVASLASEDGLLLRTRLRMWMVEGTDALRGQDTFRGVIRGMGDEAGKARLELASVLQIDAERAGFSPEIDATWTADPDDTIALGARLEWSPTRLVSALAEAQALAEYSDQEDFVGVLSQLLDCETLAGAISEPNAGYVYSTCDAACAEDLCTSALGTLWSRARGDATKTQTLQVSAAGGAVVNEQARPASFTGSWLGTFPNGESSVVGGTITGSSFDTPN